MPVTNYRALHYVLKVGNLKKNIELFRDKLGMKVLRHEVFDEGCEAACNGPYDNKWSKTMIGYGPEDDHFVLELTYNYSIGHYKKGNDLQYIKISLKQDTYEKLLKCEDWKESLEDKLISIDSPDGYKFNIVKDENIPQDDITEVCLSCSELEATSFYWANLLKMEIVSETDKELKLRYGQNQSILKFREIGGPIEHHTAYGRIAFSCPSSELQPIQTLVKANAYDVLKPYVSLETPGKATVQVVILADSDGHEICFVGDEGFRLLSKVDINANDLIEKSMAEDSSEEWFKNKGKSKADA